AAEDVSAEEEREGDEDDQPEAAAGLADRDRKAAFTAPALGAALLHVALSLDPLPAHGFSVSRWGRVQTRRARRRDRLRPAVAWPTRALSRTHPAAVGASRRRSRSGRPSRSRRRSPCARSPRAW